MYRVAPEPSSSRVAVWRDLKRIGAHYLQQCVCVVPRQPDLRAAVDGVREKIGRLGGSSNLFDPGSMFYAIGQNAMNGTRVPSGRSAAASMPLIGRPSLIAMAMGH